MPLGPKSSWSMFLGDLKITIGAKIMTLQNVIAKLGQKSMFSCIFVTYFARNLPDLLLTYF